MDGVFSKVAKPLTREEFYRMIDSDAVLRTIRSIEKTADEEQKNKLKAQLPVAYYACLCPEGGKRPKLEYAEPSGLCVHDWDHMEVDVREFYLINIKGREEELGIVLAHKSPRGCGLRLVTEMKGGETIEMCQRRMAADLVWRGLPTLLSRTSLACRLCLQGSTSSILMRRSCLRGLVKRWLGM